MKLTNRDRASGVAVVVTVTGLSDCLEVKTFESTFPFRQDHCCLESSQNVSVSRSGKTNMWVD